jgi:hypothetical protein
VHVDQRVRELVVRRRRELVERVGRVEAPVGDGLEQLLRLGAVHARERTAGGRARRCAPSPGAAAATRVGGVSTSSLAVVATGFSVFALLVAVALAVQVGRLRRTWEARALRAEAATCARSARDRVRATPGR